MHHPKTSGQRESLRRLKGEWEGRVLPYLLNVARQILMIASS